MTLIPQLVVKGKVQILGTNGHKHISHILNFRVSFHSVKDSSSAGAPTGVSSDQDEHGDHRDERDLTSSSLPTPPPPPLQEHISY